MRVAILRFHSHSDRSFLDDRDLAVLSGDLRQSGLANDLFEVVFDENNESTAGELNHEVEQRLAARLREYDLIAYQRVHSVARLSSLRARLPGGVFVQLEGEHALSSETADYVCQHPLCETVLSLVAYLSKGGVFPGGVQDPKNSLRKTGPKPDPGKRPFRPNLEPVHVNPRALPEFRSFSVIGNRGCPYQSDARDNPVYAGVTIPEGYGRGCAFCTTGNFYERGADTVERVLEELSFLTSNSQARCHIVLKDQNPFAYLTELMGRCAELRLKPFTLLLETRADWFLKAEGRFARALLVAQEHGFSIAPYLVGIENFSQPELDRFNKGITAEDNKRFLNQLRAWKASYGPALNLDHASFGFVLFTPWTTLDDLRENYEAISETRFNELRGKLLLSRARLYADNALYYLAQRDGLLTPEFASVAEDNSRRFGYLPAHPWRFKHAEVAHFSELATELCERSGGRDELWLFKALLEAFDAGTWQSLRIEDVAARVAGGGRGGIDAPPELLQRLQTLAEPLDLTTGFAGGWQLGSARLGDRELLLSFRHPQNSALELSLALGRSDPVFARSRHYGIVHAHDALSAAQRQALDAFCRAVQANDKP